MYNKDPLLGDHDTPSLETTDSLKQTKTGIFFH